jgi:hypothetical protein
MKKLVTGLLVALLATLVLSGCIRQVSPQVNTSELADVDFSKSTSWKEGKACQMRVLLFPPFGLASVKLAAESAKLKKVKLVDYNFEDYIVIQRACVLAYGE